MARARYREKAMNDELDFIDWNLYYSGYDARLRGDAFDPDERADWQFGWKDCDIECQSDAYSNGESEGDSQG